MIGVSSLRLGNARQFSDGQKDYRCIIPKSHRFFSEPDVITVIIPHNNRQRMLSGSQLNSAESKAIHIQISAFNTPIETVIVA